MKDGTQLLYLAEDSGRLCDNGVYLKPGTDNVAVVGKDLSGDLADAFVERGICAVYAPLAVETETVSKDSVSKDSVSK